jgi:hypothetical protein
MMRWLRTIGRGLLRLGLPAPAMRRYAQARLDAARNSRAAQRYDAAIIAYQDALAAGADAQIYYELAVAQEAICRWQDAMQSLQIALECAPGHPLLRYNLSLLQLLFGDYAQGLAGYEMRRYLHDQPRSAQVHATMTEQWLSRQAAPDHLPSWDGAPLHTGTGEGKPVPHLLLWAEQGYGDCLMMLRFLPQAIERARAGGQAVAVSLYADAALARLIASSFPDVCIVTAIEPDVVGHYTAHFPLMSLPYLLGVHMAHLSRWPVPYVRIPEECRAQGYRRLAAALPPEHPQGPRPMRVGVVWAGETGPGALTGRSLSFELLAPLLKRFDHQWVSLQKNPPDLSAIDVPLIDLMAQCHDFLDTAALMVHLDVVISVDTAVAHLAGALGVPVWLLCRYESEWRWMLKRSDSLWYPTMRIFRQNTPGDWPGVIARVSEALHSWSPTH